MTHRKTNCSRILPVLLCLAILFSTAAALTSVPAAHDVYAATTETTQVTKQITAYTKYMDMSWDGKLGSLITSQVYEFITPEQYAAGWRIVSYSVSKYVGGNGGYYVTDRRDNTCVILDFIAAAYGSGTQVWSSISGSITCTITNPKYNLTFVLDGGNRVGGGELSQSVIPPTLPVEPLVQRDGYIFKGWDKPLNNITADMTITALWEKIVVPVYTVTFDLNGGTKINGLTQQQVSRGDNATPPEIEREGYTFLGWSGVYTNVQADCTVTALWEIKTYTVIFLLDGGTHTGGELTQTIEHGQNAVLPLVEREGYTFGGWDNPYMNIKSDRTLSPLWSLNWFYVNFNLSGGIRIGGGTTSQKIDYGQAAEAPLIKRDGFIFQGWDIAFDNVKSALTVNALWNIAPQEPQEPVDPQEPSDPQEPAEPSEPQEPTEPQQPTDPTEPQEPSDPQEPSEAFIFSDILFWNWTESTSNVARIAGWILNGLTIGAVFLLLICIPIKKR